MIANNPSAININPQNTTGEHRQLNTTFATITDVSAPASFNIQAVMIGM